jgi:hypothetical protein
VHKLAILVPYRSGSTLFFKKNLESKNCLQKCKSHPFVPNHYTKNLKKKVMKKLLKITVAVLVIANFFTACSKENILNETGKEKFFTYETGKVIDTPYRADIMPLEKDTPYVLIKIDTPYIGSRIDTPYIGK